MSGAAQPLLVYHRVRLGRHTLGYGVAGAGPSVVLIHGLSGSTRWWRRNVPALAAQFRVYVVDLVGFGTSRGSRFALAEAAALLAGWMDVVGVGYASLIGEDLSLAHGLQPLAQRAALGRPDRTSRESSW